MQIILSIHPISLSSNLHLARATADRDERDVRRSDRDDYRSDRDRDRDDYRSGSRSDRDRDRYVSDRDRDRSKRSRERDDGARGSRRDIDDQRDAKRRRDDDINDRGSRGSSYADAQHARAMGVTSAGADDDGMEVVQPTEEELEEARRVEALLQNSSGAHHREAKIAGIRPTEKVTPRGAPITVVLFRATKARVSCCALCVRVWCVVCACVLCVRVSCVLCRG